MATDSITVESMVEQVSALSNHAWGIIEMASRHEDVPEYVSSALDGASKSMNDILRVMDRLRPSKPAEKLETNGEPPAESDGATDHRNNLTNIIDGLNERHSWAISTLAVLIMETEDYCLSNALGGIQSHLESAREQVKKLNDWRNR